MRTLFSALASICFLIHLSGQEMGTCDEAKNFITTFNGECVNQISANNCVNLDITDSYDFEGKEFEFLWEMGDGTTQEGLSVNHCYANPGFYEATLSLKDPMTKAIIKEEASINIVIKGSFKLVLNSLDDVRALRTENFGYEMEYPDSAYQVRGSYWHLGDGTFSCDSAPEYSYPVAGKYMRTLMVELTSSLDTVVLCAQDSVNVKIHDPSEGLLEAALNEKVIDSRFLMDRVTYKLLAKLDGNYKEISDYSALTGGNTYRIVVFKGNYLFDSQDIVTAESESSKDVQNKISSAAKKLASEKVYELQPIIFELDQDELSRKNKSALKDNVEILQESPMLKVAIGVYTSSKGSLDRAIQLSIGRAELIRNYLIENGVDGNRLITYDPSTSRSLINSCLTASDCDYVNPNLDRRADFKILK